MGLGRSPGPLGWCAVVEISSQFWHSLLHAGVLRVADAGNKRDPCHHAWPSWLSSPGHRLLGMELLQVLSTALCPGPDPWVSQGVPPREHPPGSAPTGIHGITMVCY